MKIVIVDFMKHIPTMEFKPSVVLPWYAILQILGVKSLTDNRHLRGGFSSSYEISLVQLC